MIGNSEKIRCNNSSYRAIRRRSFMQDNLPASLYSMHACGRRCNRIDVRWYRNRQFLIRRSNHQFWRPIVEYPHGWISVWSEIEIDAFRHRYRNHRTAWGFHSSERSVSNPISSNRDRTIPVRNLQRSFHFFLYLKIRSKTNQRWEYSNIQRHSNHPHGICCWWDRHSDLAADPWS